MPVHFLNIRENWLGRPKPHCRDLGEVNMRWAEEQLRLRNPTLEQIGVGREGRGEAKRPAQMKCASACGGCDFGDPNRSVELGIDKIERATHVQCCG